LLPQRRVVRLEHSPLQVDENLFDDGEAQAADVDVAPERVEAERARAPHEEAAARKTPKAVDALRVAAGLRRVVQRELELDDARQRLASGRARDALARLHSRVDSGDVAA